MRFGIIILTRILFAACMVFIIGYVVGNFSRNPALTRVTKFAATTVEEMSVPGINRIRFKANSL